MSCVRRVRVWGWSPVSADAPATVNVSTSTAGFLRTHRELALALPHHEETWTKEEAPDLVGGRFRKLIALKLIVPAERTYNHEGNWHQTHWRTRREVVEWVAANVDRSRAPCGHGGVRCIEAGETYTCLRDDCAATFGRGVAEEVLTG